MARFPLAIKIANVLVYLFSLGSNVYSVVGPEKEDSPFGDSRPTYIDPAPFAFAVWGLIHFLLGGFVIYQFFTPANDAVIKGIHWNFVILGLLNAIWLSLWQTGHYILAFIEVLFVCSSVSYIYHVIRRRFPAENINDTLWIHAPFSLYHAWITVVAVINAFAAFGQEVTAEGPSTLTIIFVVIGLLFLKGTAVGYVEYGRGDIVGSLVISYVLFAIFIEQQQPVIHWVALGLSLISLFYTAKPTLVKTFFPNLDLPSERAPLLG